MNLKWILLLLIVLSACSNKGDSTSSVDTTMVTEDNDEAETEPEDEGGGAYDPNASPYPEIQNQLVDFLSEFESVKEKSKKVMFELHTDYEGARYTFHFTESKLTFLDFRIEGEGGYQEIITIKPSIDSEILLNTNLDGGSYFTFPKDGLPKFFKVELDKEGNPLVKEVLNYKAYDYWSIVTEHLKTIEAHKSEFSGNGEWREFFLQKETVKSDYGGNTEISKRYQVDNSLMNINLVELVNRPSINAEAIQGYINRYEPLYDNGKGYELRKLCGESSYLNIYIEDDQYIWDDRGYQDAWEAKIIGFEEGEGDEYIISILQSGSIMKKTIVKDPNDKTLVFVNGKPYTTNPKNYSVVDNKSDCQ